MFKMKVDLTKDPILKSLLIFAFPLFVANVFQQLYNTMDTMIVGNFLGDTSLAAIGACGAIYELLVGFALGVGNGLSIVTARSFGAKDENLLKKSVAGSIVIGILLTIILMLFSQFCLYPLLELLNTPANIINEAYDYIFMSSVLNVGLDLLFITQFNMGIQGAAIATVIAQGVSAILCFYYIYKKCPILLPHKEHFKISRELYQELAGQGFSMGLMMSIVSTGTVILQTAINKFGYLIIAGHTAARKLYMFFMMPAATLGLALSTFVSQNKGANQGLRIRQGVRYANLIAVGWSVIATVVLFFIAPTLVQLLSGSSSAVVIDNGSLYLMLNAPFYCMLGILLNLRNSLQGLGRKIIPLVSSIIEFIGKIVFVWLFIPLLGYFGVIICEPVIWCCMCLQLAYSFYRDPYIKEYRNIKKEAVTGK